MAIVEDVTENEMTGNHNGDPGPSSSAELINNLRHLLAQLKLPEDLLPAFMREEQPVEALQMYRSHAVNILHQIRALIDSPIFRQLEVQAQSELLFDCLRLYGHDSWTSEEIRDHIDEMTSPLDRTRIAVHLLTLLRPIFSRNTHPLLHPETSRVLSRPAGGPDAHSDFHDESAQIFKSPSHWGSYNVLSWACTHLPPSEVEKRIGGILPPTLVLMDDWEPPWRGKGVRILQTWMDKVPVDTMRRMGMDKLLVKTLVHTLTLQPNPPLKGVLEVTLDLLRRTTKAPGREKERAVRIEEIMDSVIVKGWMYAKSGPEGRPVLIHIAKQVEVMCQEIGEGIVRWLKAIIPHLLDPLQYLPTPSVIPHYTANLSALLCVMETCRSTGRIPRWRGQILDMISRLWVQLDEQRGGDLSDNIPDGYQELSDLAVKVVTELPYQSPGVLENEAQTLLDINKRLFGPLLAVTG